jgi:hypothetical protein
VQDRPEHRPIRQPLLPYYAESEDGGVWEGDYEAYVYDESFDSCRGFGSTAGYLVGFRVISMDATDLDHTVNLVD